MTSSNDLDGNGNPHFFFRQKVLVEDGEAPAEAQHTQEPGEGSDASDLMLFSSDSDEVGKEGDAQAVHSHLYALLISAKYVVPASPDLQFIQLSTL